MEALEKKEMMAVLVISGKHVIRKQQLKMKN
jgi:hypothetical protein